MRMDERRATSPASQTFVFHVVVRQWLVSQARLVWIVWLPTYWPNLDPIERV